MTTADDIMRIAAEQVGYVGGADKRNRYTEEYGVYCDWCVIFIWWVFKHAGASSLFGTRCALCSKLYNQHKQQAVRYDALQRGDIVFFDWTGEQVAFNHVGIVERRDSSYVYTIEGNTNNSVLRRKRKRQYVSHAYRPAYAAAGGGETVPETPIQMVQIDLPVLRKGSKGFEVRTLQRLLKSYGYSLRPYGIDGDFGAITEQRLREYQRKQKLPENGETDRATWDKLLKG